MSSILSNLFTKSKHSPAPPPPPPPPPPIQHLPPHPKPVKAKQHSSKRLSLQEAPKEKVASGARAHSHSEEIFNSEPEDEADVSQHPRHEHKPPHKSTHAKKVRSQQRHQDFQDAPKPVNTVEDEYVHVSPVVSRNDVPFFEDAECSDPEDDFAFTCCMPPLAPRHTPNPRPQRPWDPSVLPTNTHIPTSIGSLCKRCGKEVFLAEMHLSSRGVYHTECYKCCLCGKTLDSYTVSEHKGELFCRGCYRRNFALPGVGFGVGAGVLQTP